MNARRLARFGEWTALLWLVAHGYRVRHRNWVGGLGEIDLVLQKGRTIVFVEVKSRVGQEFGGALAAVGRAKQNKLARAAQAYLTRFALWNAPCRFDVVAVTRRRGFFPWKIVHIEDAFQPSLGRKL